jgi:CTP synthase (UTP-ammonia lyase)
VNRDLLSSEADSKTASYILNTIREEEQQTELLKKASSGKMVNLGAADAVDTKDVAAEQSYNREQVQEQEQVRFCVCLWEVWLLGVDGQS